MWHIFRKSNLRFICVSISNRQPSDTLAAQINLRSASFFSSSSFSFIKQNTQVICVLCGYGWCLCEIQARTEICHHTFARSVPISNKQTKWSTYIYIYIYKWVFIWRWICSKVHLKSWWNVTKTIATYRRI